MGWPDTTRRNAYGEIEFGGVSAVELAKTFGTPLYLFDERTLVDARAAFVMFSDRLPAQGRVRRQGLSLAHADGDPGARRDRTRHRLGW